MTRAANDHPSDRAQAPRQAKPQTEALGMSFDSLTGLPDRALFRDRLAKATAGALRDGRMVAVFCLGIDDLAKIATEHGRPFADRVLETLADRLRARVRGADSAGRLDQDELGIIQVGIEQDGACHVLAQRLLELLARPITIERRTIVPELSIGITLIEEAGEDPEAWWQQARLARQKARADGPGRWRCADPELDARLTERRALEEDLDLAIADDQMTLHYQPIVAMADRRIVGFEALLRWHHPERGLLAPLEFLRIAEESGAIVDLGAWTLRQACVDAVGWPASAMIAVNVSAVQLRRGNLIAAVGAALSVSGLDPTRLQLDITESALTRDDSQTLPVLRRLRELGVGIAMDDFGTGCSSLSHLKSFPFERVKIDRSLIANLPDDDAAATLARTVIAMGKSLDMRVTAEGVEDDAQMAMLSAAGCDEVQGFYFSRPLPLAELHRLFHLIDDQGVQDWLGTFGGRTAGELATA
jgi:diguanylate cyclase (GGDEF)-like protein